MSTYKAPMIICTICLVLFGCSKSDDWVCREGKNANGDVVQYSENVKTGEMAGYDKCQK